MSASTSKSAGNADGAPHAFDYYYRPGMALRPWPQRSTGNRELWDSARRDFVEPMVAAARLSSPGPLVGVVADHQWQGDELMDDVVLAFRRIGMAEGRRMLEQALDHGIETVPDAPAELVRLFAALDNPPAWHDLQRWERGRQVWINASFAGKAGMAVMDALATFVGNDVSTATGATRRFINDYQRRMFESYTWFWNVTRESAMDRHSPFFKDTVKVRLMHSQVRAGLRRAWGEESFERNGCPISCTAMLMGAISFGILPMLVDLAHGRKHSHADLDDAMIYWAHISYVFGVAEEVIPTTAADGIELLNYYLPYTGGPTEATVEMSEAAAANLSDEDGNLTLKGRAVTGPLLAMMAYFGGEPAVRALVATTPARDIPIAGWVRLIGLLVIANVWVNRLFDKLPFRSARLRRRAAKGDRFWRLNVLTSRAAAKRKGILTTPYDHHDTTS
ncbi:oxygenase MpaB family protein [Nocardia sp. NPDC058518]|uniref:oxygenase MpaB family protein n=1 Tax=Nocardia sp. NPDC058518 TaxID=3346534 RepID=UPI00365004E6